MKKYRYIEIAPSRSAYDPIYLTFENIKTKVIIYRKALRWDLKKMNIYDEAIESIEGLPHTMKVPLRRALRHAKKEHELLKLYKRYSKGFISGKLCVQQLYDINLKIKAIEKELEELK